MKYTRKILALMLVFSLCIITSCGEEKDSSIGSEDNGGGPKISDNVAQDALDQNSVSVGKFLSLIGATDAQVVETIGEGEKSLVDGKLAGREYTDSVYDGTGICTVLYNDDKVTSVFINYEGQQMEFNNLVKGVTNDYGKPTKENKEEGEDTAKTVEWDMSNGSIFVFENDGICGIQISA